MMSDVEAIEDRAVRDELKGIIADVTVQLPRYIAMSSLMFMLSSVIYVVFRSVSPLIAKSKEKAVESFEVEAYRDAKFDGYVSA